MDTCSDVAIIVVNYNGYKDTIECIKSILEANIESKIVIVDNASKYDEAKIISEMFPEAVSIKSDINGGFSAGNNIGINYALENGYEYILLLNNDTIIDTDLVRILKENTTPYNICAPKMLYCSEPDIIWYGGGYINRMTGNAKHSDINTKDDKNKGMRDCTFATGCCMMITAITFKKIGLLEEDFFMYCEDTDFCIRLANAGIIVKYVPKAVLWHKVSSSTQGSDSIFSTYYMTRNRLNYIKKYNDYFTKSAYLFSLISRYTRAFECYLKKDIRYKYFLKAINDHGHGIKGKVDLS